MSFPISLCIRLRSFDYSLHGSRVSVSVVMDKLNDNGINYIFVIQYNEIHRNTIHCIWTCQIENTGRGWEEENRA